MIADWAIILLALVVLFVLWKFMEYVLDLFAYAMNAAHEREELSPDKEKRSSS